ncbi:hypothetical protein [Streptomyces sp. AC495_CC817]|uniref:hypothetical protein n=1 Tax=Streptomyces sp. AC495_CC817 TaxID=2823900 RepID=UPI001C279ABD|nr:hypothetical protein [Streptomyces sp. AC495_CC817]
MNATDASIDQRIRAFAASVRQHLDDLPADELDEILGGLSADLAEQAADNDGVLDLGDPAAYAEELRTAAGLPPRGARRARRPFREGLAVWRAEVAENLRRSAFGSWLLDFLIALRPVWWVLRGFGLYALLTVFPTQWAYAQYGRNVVPVNPIEAALLLGCVVLSVQWGRGLWLPKSWLRRARTVISILAVVMLPVALYSLVAPRVEYVDSGGYMPQGLQLDGVQVGNIFAFDENGDPIDHVQLFTGKGTPLNLYGADGASEGYGWHGDGESVTLPLRDYRDQPIWNVYPLDEARFDDEKGEPKASTIRQPSPPFQRAPSIAEAEPTPTPTPTPGAEVTPTPTPAP